MHYVAQGHPIPPPYMATQSAPYAPPNPPANERFQRPLVGAFPTSPPHGRHQSPSPSEESHHANGDSDAQIEPDDSQHNIYSGPSRGSGEVSAPRTNEAWREREVNCNATHEGGRSAQAFESSERL